MAVTSIRNETPSRLTLTSIEGTQIVLAPLQEREIGEHSAFHFDDLEREGVLTQRREAPGELGENIATAVLGGGFWIVVIAMIITNVQPWFGISAAAWPFAVWGFFIFVLLCVVAGFIIKGTNSLSLVVRWTMQAVALTVILAIGLGLPAATIYFFGGGGQLLAGLGTSAGQPLALFGRLLQLAIIATASLLPVLLFFLFDRYQLNTLRRRLYANLFRLDRGVTTTGEIDAKYGSQIREAYGTDEQGQGRLSPGTRWPVLVCAFVITLGWIVALAPVGTSFAPSTAADVVAALLPQRETLVYGFLGVYFFSLRLIGIRYARGDLKPKAYTHIVVRVFIVIVLSWVLEAISGDTTPGLVLFLAFLFGITPDEFFTWAKAFFRGKMPASAVPQQTLPLNELEGIDLYDLSRLESEGIVNIEGLAHHELIDLIIETRVPVPRLVDWVDQAILFLHLSGGTQRRARARLRDFGIRTATDLLGTWNEAEKRGGNEHEAFKKLLGDSKAPYRLEVIRDALLDDEWMSVVLCWRNEEPHPELERQAVPTSRASLERRALEELAGERYGRALKFFSEALQIQDTADVRRKIARILAAAPVVELRDPDRAKEHANRAFELAPDDYSGLVELIGIYLRLEDADSADAACERALRAANAWPRSKRKEQQQAVKHLAQLREQIDALKGGDAEAAE